MNDNEIINKEEVFAYLDSIRESGIINMFSSSPYVEEAFGLHRRDARKLVLEWMETFSKRHNA